MEENKKKSLRRWISGNRDLFRVIFLPMDIMAKKYPVLKKCPVLYPLCWLHRVLFRGFGRMRKKDVDVRAFSLSVREENLKTSNGTQRVEMFRMLDMM